jgi:hypothetical protein
MYPEGSTPGTEIDDPLQEGRALAGQCGEFIHHDDEAGRGSAGGGSAERIQIFRSVLREELLSEIQLGTQRSEGAIHEVSVEIGDHPNRMRKA